MTTDLFTARFRGHATVLGPHTLLSPLVVRVVTAALAALDLEGADEKAFARPAPRNAAARTTPSGRMSNAPSRSMKNWYDDEIPSTESCAGGSLGRALHWIPRDGSPNKGRRVSPQCSGGQKLPPHF
jgi:hypothetical protein